MKGTSTISIRIPKTMVDELRVVMEKEHFIDLSEAVRSIIRSKWIKKHNNSLSNKADMKNSKDEVYELLKKKGLIDKLLEKN